MKIFRATTAIFHGLRIVLSERSVRSLAVRPWAIGFVSYCLTCFGAIRAHAPLVHWMAGDPTSVGTTILHAGAWILSALLLLVGSMIVSISIVLVLAGLFQSAIAAAVLVHLGSIPPETGDSFLDLAGETGRSILVELKKLIWLLPLMSLAFVLGFIPLLSPFALLVAAWLLAYQFVDTVLDLFKLGAGDRLRFATRHAPLLIVFGAVLTLCWAVPFLGIILAPAASAGAAWLLADDTFAAELGRPER
ncbi:MAG: EI24 domain-containing protein [Bdellovibrionota bacterium]